MNKEIPSSRESSHESPPPWQNNHELEVKPEHEPAKVERVADINEVRRGVEAVVQSAEDESSKQLAERTPDHKAGPTPKAQRKQSYQAIMKDVRSELPAPSRAFSKVIHNPTVEKISDAIGGTVARPNAILSGSVLAFLFTLAIYLVARFNGYPLSGTETIAAFAIGWAFGLVFDYIRLLVIGKR